jgi:uncharacterized protein YcaQ
MTTLAHLRACAATQSLFAPTTLERALSELGFVQADPIRAPARAQDLVLRHRVAGYRVGDLERRYSELAIAEDFFVNYGFVTHEVQALMHPRPPLRAPAERRGPWPAERVRRARAILRFVRARGEVHPREVDARFAHGKARSYWGGSSNATTMLLDAMHYRGLLRVVRRDGGVRVYAAHEHARAPRDAASRRARLDALVDVIVRIYAPLTSTWLSWTVRRLRFAAPQWSDEVSATLAHAKERLAHARVDGIDWYWSASQATREADARVRLLAPFDPVVQDRLRFEHLWGWEYRFEAYTPASKRKLGYYALPLLWRDDVVGWANVSVSDGALRADVGYVRRPRERAFVRELDAEIERMRVFLGAR